MTRNFPNFEQRAYARTVVTCILIIGREPNAIIDHNDRQAEQLNSTDFVGRGPLVRGLGLLLGAKRTSKRQPTRSQIDPERTSRNS